jgi:hypothetical protein
MTMDDMMFWGIFFILGWIGGLLMRSRSIGRLEGECWRLRKIYHEHLRTINKLEGEVRDARRTDRGAGLDGLRFRVGPSGGILAGKTFSLKKIHR